LAVGNEVAKKLYGIFPPIPTPFLDGEVAHDRLAENLEQWNKAPLKGYIVLGSNGEFPFLTTQEKFETVRTVVEAAKPAGKAVIAGVSCESARESIEHAKQASGLGTDFVIAVTPHYYKPKMTHEALTAYYAAVADASPVPLLIYSMPAYTGITVAPETVAELSKHPNIAGIKDSGGVMALTGAYVAQSAPGFTVMAGSGSFLYPGMMVGCRGGILALANTCPRECCHLYELALEGGHEEARELQLRLVEPNTAVTSRYGIAGLKYAMELFGYFGGEVRLPLMPASDEDRKSIEDIFRRAGLL
jgi:4-hydroxy-2-oxoglutarate aldolase